MCVWPTHTRLERHADNRRCSKPWSRGRWSQPGWCAAHVSAWTSRRGSTCRRRRYRGSEDDLRGRALTGCWTVLRPAAGTTRCPETVEAVQLALSPPPAGRSRWTTRLLGQAVGLTSGCVSDVLRAHGIKPHLTRTYKVSQDPAFAAVTDVVACTSTLPNTRLCSVSTRRRPSRPWSVPNRRSPYGLAAPCGTRTTIGGTGSSISSPPLRSRPAT